MSEELDSTLISKFNGMDTGLKPKLGLKSAKYESVTPGIFLATMGITLIKVGISALLQSSHQKKR